MSFIVSALEVGMDEQTYRMGYKPRHVPSPLDSDILKKEGLRSPSYVDRRYHSAWGQVFLFKITMMDSIEKAIKIAMQAHEGQVDRGGKPYILHPLAVMLDVVYFGSDYMIAAVLHDVIEDSDITLDHIVEQGFSAEVIEALQLLTKSKDKTYDNYISDIKGNGIARVVKMSDLKHNMQLRRLKRIKTSDMERYKKYKNAYEELLKQ
jgi:(p)ppGpp synthase/HD superfamily hydrolase